MKAQRILAFAPLCFGLAFAAPASADGGPSSTLPNNYALFEGQSLVSDSCYYSLAMQTDGNLVVYAGAEGNASDAIWANNLAGSANASNFMFVTFEDGNLAEYDANSIDGGVNLVWQTNTGKGKAGTLWMQNDGNLVVYPSTSPGSNDWWASNSVHGGHANVVPCSVDSHYTKLLDNEVIVGDTFEYYCFDEGTTVTWPVCGDECARTAGCTGWSYTISGDSTYCAKSDVECDLKGVPSNIEGTPLAYAMSGVVLSYSGL